MATLVRTVFDHADAGAVAEQFGKVVDQLAKKHPAAAEHLDAAREQGDPPPQRFVGIFPNRGAVIRRADTTHDGEVTTTGLTA